MSCCHIYTIDDFLNQGTLLSTELKWLTLPESKKGGSLFSVCASVLDFSTIAYSVKTDDKEAKFFKQNNSLHRKHNGEVRREQARLLLLHNTVISGLMPHALIKMVCTQNFTFQTSHNERNLTKALWNLLPSRRITSIGQGAWLIFCPYGYVIMMQHLKFLGGTPIQVLSRPNVA